MRKFSILLLVFILAASGSAQVKIGDNSTQLDSSAILELQSEQQGFLLPRMSMQKRDSIRNPSEGLLIYNTDSRALNIYIDGLWYLIDLGLCDEHVTPADAGPNQSATTGQTINLAANTPEKGSGYWQILEGAGASIANSTSPSSQFTGTVGLYILEWVITLPCDTSRDTVFLMYQPIIDPVFVSLKGDDANPGTKAQPVLTIQHGINLAQTLTKTDVFIAEGEYYESVMLASGINLRGGFDSLSWSWNPSLNQSRILGGTKAVSCIGCTNVSLDGLVIESDDGNQVERNSYGVYMVNATNIDIGDCEIIAGEGGYGLSGSDGSNGDHGMNGSDGQPGCQNGAVIGCPTCTQPVGGFGGLSADPYNSTAGGQGGLPGLGSQPGQSGFSGNDPYVGPANNEGAGGTGDSTATCGVYNPSYAANGGDGNYGLAGADGPAGGLLGTVSGASEYIPSSGGHGSNGFSAQGGGGGGGGAGGDLFICYTYGSSGGGGGSGGQGGTRGYAGIGGGGSFGIWVINGTSIQLENLVIQTRDGGYGGNGGSGGIGGGGGYGGSPVFGGAAQGDAGCGGWGGTGGDGGRGGHGGGGGGGPSIGIFKSNSTTGTYGNLTFILGNPGAGGSSAGNAGDSGISQNVYTY